MTKKQEKKGEGEENIKEKKSFKKQQLEISFEIALFPIDFEIKYIIYHILNHHICYI